MENTALAYASGATVKETELDHDAYQRRDGAIRIRLLNEVKQLTMLKKLRRRIYGPEDREIRHLDNMIRERRVRLYGTL